MAFRWWWHGLAGASKAAWSFICKTARRVSRLWEMVMAAGRPYQISPAAPSTIERIEGGLLSYGNDMTLENNPLEIGLDRYCDLAQPFDFIGKAALRRMQVAEGVRQKLMGLVHRGRSDCRGMSITGRLTIKGKATPDTSPVPPTRPG